MTSLNKSPNWDKIETLKWEEIPFSSEIVPRGLSIAGAQGM